MFYAMRRTDGVSTRIGRMTKNPDTAIRCAKRHGGYVEQQGRGLYWPLDLEQLKKVYH